MKIPVLSLTCMIFLSIGCKKADKLTEFNMQYDQSVVIPSSTGINLPFDVITPDISTNSESTFSANNTRKDLIQEIRLKEITLRITSPSNADFSFLKSIEAILSTDGLPDTKIAWKENVPDNVGGTLSLDLTGNDLKEYIKKDKFVLKLNTVTDKLLSSDYKIDVTSKFFIKAKLFKK